MQEFILWAKILVPLIVMFIIAPYITDIIKSAEVWVVNNCSIARKIYEWNRRQDAKHIQFVTYQKMLTSNPNYMSFREFKDRYPVSLYREMMDDYIRLRGLGYNHEKCYKAIEKKYKETEDDNQKTI